MKLVRNNLVRTIALAVIAILVTLTAASPAEAGCMREYDDCGHCARSAMFEAIFELDLGALHDAYLDGIDCDIDFVHCLMFAHHHQYECGGV